MIRDYFESLFFNIQQKAKSNILGAIIIVWIFRNWDLVYALFYFDKEMEMMGRINWIKAYFPGYRFYWDLLWTVLEAFVVLLVTYGLKAGGSYLANIYENRVSTRITEKSNPTRIIDLNKYEKLDEYSKRLEKKVSEERQKRQDFETEVDRLEKQLTKEKEKSSGKIADELAARKILDSDKGDVLKNISNSIMLETQQKDGKNYTGVFEVLKKIKAANFNDDFKKVIEDISVGLEIWQDSKSTKFLAAMGIIEKSGTSNMNVNTAYFKFTEFGIKIKNEFVRKEYL